MLTKRIQTVLEELRVKEFHTFSNNNYVCNYNILCDKILLIN